MEEAFGEVQDEKEIKDKKNKLMELKKSKVAETFHLLAQKLTFSDSFMPFIQHLS